jgi:hypothetical protein
MNEERCFKTYSKIRDTFKVWRKFNVTISNNRWQIS